MKTALYILITAATIGILGWAYYAYGSYFPVYPRKVAASYLIDKTEASTMQPNASELLQPLGLKEHTWESIDLNLRTISKYDYTAHYDAHLAGHFFILANPADRDKEIDTFTKKVNTIIETINGLPNGTEKSSIYVPLVQEANKVAASKADLKIVVAYTDCNQNTPTFSIYRERDRKLLKEHPEKVKQLFEELAKPGNLHGVKLYIIFNPTKDRDNEYFMLMSAFYKKLFEDAGAQVFIQANLQADNS